MSCEIPASIHINDHTQNRFCICTENSEYANGRILLYTTIEYIIIIIGFLINVQAHGASSTSVGPFPGNWLAARIADLTPNLQVLLS